MEGLFKTNKIRKRLLYTNIFFILLPLFIFFICVLYGLFSAGNRDINRVKLSVLEQQSVFLDKTIVEIMTISNTLLLDSEVNKILSARNFSDEYAFLVASNKIQRRLINAAGLYPSENYTK